MSSPSTSLTTPKHQSTRNNSIREALLQENVSVTDLSNEITSIESPETNALKYTCLECNFKTTEKSCMNLHVNSLHVSVQLEEVNFIFGVCNHEFVEADDYNAHVKVHDKPAEICTPENNPSPVINITADNDKERTINEIVPELYQCVKCDFTFSGLLDLNSHIEMMHRYVSPIEKPTGERILAGNHGEDIIDIIDVDVEEHPSELCSASIAVTEVICPFCKLMSKNVMSLKTHIENVHNSTKTINDETDVINMEGSETCFQCPHCDYVGSKSELETHISKKHGYIAICGEVVILSLIQKLVRTILMPFI